MTLDRTSDSVLSGHGSQPSGINVQARDQTATGGAAGSDFHSVCLLEDGIDPAQTVLWRFCLSVEFAPT